MKYVLVLASLLVACLLPGSAAAQFSSGQYYRIYARHVIDANLTPCLDIENASAYDNALVQQWPCNPTAAQDNQLWTLVPTGSGTFRIVAANSAKCLDVVYPYGNGAAVQQYACNLNALQANQVFSVTPSTPGYYRISTMAAGTPRCLDVPNWSTSAGTKMQVWDCAPGFQSNQDWLIATNQYLTRQPFGHIQSFAYYGENEPLAEVGDRVNTIVYTTASLPDVANVAPYGIKAELALIEMLKYKTKHADVGCDPNLGPTVCDNTGLFANHPTDGGVRTDICSYWAQKRSQLAAYMPHVRVFYLDEPFWNFQIVDPQWSVADRQNMVRIVAEVVKGQSSLCTNVQHPEDASIPFAIVEAYPTVGIQAPAAVDWVGFDCYEALNDCNGPLDGNYPNFMTLWNTQKSLLLPHQRLVIVPSAKITRDPVPYPYDPISAVIGTTPQEQANEAARADFYLTLALSEPKVVAVWPWHWPSRYAEYADANGNPVYGLDHVMMWIGAKDMPIMKEKWRFLARAIGFGTP
jgi:Ricin-type beta-trefoil lectin domain